MVLRVRAQDEVNGRASNDNPSEIFAYGRKSFPDSERSIKQARGAMSAPAAASTCLSQGPGNLKVYLAVGG